MSSNSGISALKEYQAKVASGEIERTAQKNPLQKWEENKTSLRLSINANCYLCMGGCKGDSAVKDIRECSSFNCPLWHVRPYK